jgi:prepilin-type N-terminal cleavage/methylation domain-containing protein
MVSIVMKKGFTLIEMLVTVGLFTIIITIAVGGFINAIRTQKQVSSLIATQSNASLVLEQMTREIRTGYLFCNAPGNTQVGTGAIGALATYAVADCGCTLSAPDGSWTCSALDFYNAQGQEVYYYRSPEGELMESSTLSATPQSVTGNTVSVKYLQFHLYGQTEGDHWPPRVTISIGITPSSTDPSVANDVSSIETTVSARSIDCVPGSDPATC